MVVWWPCLVLMYLQTPTLREKYKESIKKSQKLTKFTLKYIVVWNAL